MRRRIVCAVFIATIFFPLQGFPLDKINISHSAISGSQAVLWVVQDSGILGKHGFETQILFITGGPQRLPLWFPVTCSSLSLPVQPPLPQTWEGRTSCSS